MALISGTRLGPYEILAPIGAGGMGEVYKANDTRLDRIVAIKVLPEHLAESPERKARFEREAKAISQLNHPHICTLYDVGKQDGLDFIVMEYIEGETLAERLKKGALPLDKALEYGVQIADGLDTAHRAGIVHRDLKPPNVMLTKSGIKLLDFGLAKLIEGDVGPETSDAPTRQKDLTKEESIIGTLQYMAPEQLEGKDADARTDLFALGAMLYEMLTGRKAFEGESQASLIGAIMTSDPPPISQRQAMSPPALDHIVKTCLAKKPDERWQAAGDLGRQLKWIVEGGSQPGPPVPVTAAARRGSSTAMWIAAAIALSIVTGVAVWSLKPEPRRPVAQFVVNPSTEPPNLMSGSSDVAITSDGTRIVYRTIGAGGSQIVVRALGRREATPLGELGDDPQEPFLSPNSDWVGYYDGGALRKVSILGGPSVIICQITEGAMRGASWGADDTIVFGTNVPSGLWRVSAGGGEPEELTIPGLQQADYRWPEILPGGEAVLVTIMGNFESSRIAVLSLATGESKILVSGGSNPRYVSTGHIVYGFGGTLRAVGFDLDELEVTSDPVPVIDGVVTKFTGAVDFAISQNGSLVYVSGSTAVERTLVWVDREGREEPLTAEPRAYTLPRVSPDGTKLALDVRDQESDIWIWDFARETLTRLTVDPARDIDPAWTPDGLRVAFGSARDGVFNIFWKAADGTGAVERIAGSPNLQLPHGFSPDGTQLVYLEVNPDTRADLGVRSMDTEGVSGPLLATEFAEINGAISPDGHLLVYQSNESGQSEIYVRPFPNVDEGRWQISTGGGTRPLWRPDGRELFYLTTGGQLMAVPVRTDPSFSFGSAELVFERRYSMGSSRRTYDVSPDGERFLMIKEGANETAAAELILVQNWTEELKRLVPVDN